MVYASKDSSAYKLYAEEHSDISVKNHSKTYRMTKVLEHEKTAYKFKIMAKVIVCFVILFFVLIRYVQIYEAKAAIEKTKSELLNFQRANEQMQVEIDSKIDLKKIEETAKTKFGMRRAEKYQMVYINLKKDDYIENIKAENESFAKKIFDTVIARLSIALEYLN